jgi:glycosyltransferase involved in cell wall biosynthesis
VPQDLSTTVAVPVFNGAGRIGDTLRSITGQSRQPDVLLVYDNASTDETLEIVRSLDLGQAIRGSSANLGAARNFQRACNEANTRWFMWVASGDLLAPECLDECLSLAAARPDAKAILPAVQYIGPDDKVIGAVDNSAMGGALGIRLRHFLRKKQWTEFYSLYDTETLRKSPGFPKRYAADVELTWWFLLRGPIPLAGTGLFSYRLETESKPVHEMSKALGLTDSPRSHWRKVKLLRQLWRMSGDPELGWVARNVARRELMLALASPEWALHLQEDLSIRRRSLRELPQTPRRRVSGAVLLGLVRILGASGRRAHMGFTPID